MKDECFVHLVVFRSDSIVHALQTPWSITKTIMKCVTQEREQSFDLMANGTYD